LDESEWLNCTDPIAMLEFLRSNPVASQRKQRLLVCACCRGVWPLFQGTLNGEAIETAERQADGLAARKELRAVRRAVADRLQDGMGWREEDVGLMLDTFGGFHFEDTPSWVAGMTATIVAARSVAEVLESRHLRQVLEILTNIQPARRKDDKADAAAQAGPCGLLRCIFGCPFRPTSLIAPAWRAMNAGFTRRFAEEVYAERPLPGGTLDQTRLAVLADALEEAGADAALVEHFRDPKPHWRGCFALDHILGRK
jgi:hypothetical protein